MEKLIDLLNEYETPRSWVVYKSYDSYDWFFYWVDCDWETEIVWSDSLICSKKFWWIWWLVKEDKIDFVWISWHANIIKYLRDVEKYGWEQIKEWVVLMLLSISDEPIEDLILYLK